MFSKILEFCSGNGFLKVINHSLTKSFTLKVDPIGAIFQEILRSEWLQNFLINRDIPGILNVDNFQNSCHFAMSLLNQNIPFGIADITHNKLKLDVDGFKRLNKAVHFQSYFDNDLTLTYTIFVAPSEADQFFHQIQRQRKIWWAKISANPGRYYLSDIQGQNDEPLQVDIIAKYPFGEQKLEKIVLNKTLRSSSSNNLDLQIKDGRKTAQARFITCETKLSNLFLNGLCDAYDEAQYENGGRTRPFLRFHRKLAPFKIAFSISPTSKELFNDMSDLAIYLTKLLKHSNISTLFIPNNKKTLENQWMQFDQMGIPYQVLLRESTLKDGIAWQIGRAHV